MPRDTNAIVLRWTRTDRVRRRRSASASLPCSPVATTTRAATVPSPRLADDASSATTDREAVVTLAAGPRRRRRSGSRSTAAGCVRDERIVWVDYPEEVARGTATGERLQSIVAVEADLAPGGSVSLVLGVEAGSRVAAPLPGRLRARRRCRGRADGAASSRRPAPRPTTRASRPSSSPRTGSSSIARIPAPTIPPTGVTVIAGYPWFGDWGRDTMIALPGLTLATGRYDDARRILRTWAALVRDGLLPEPLPRGGRPGLPRDRRAAVVRPRAGRVRARDRRRDAPPRAPSRPSSRSPAPTPTARGSASASTRPTASSAAASPASS